MTSTMEKKNALVFTPKGFHQAITLQYPEENRSLIVCKKCKKNYKSRYICRKKNRHTGLPWTDTYICVFIHESCLVRMEGERKLSFIRDKVIAGQVVEKKGFDMNMPNASTDLPICSSCKHNNYTRSYCRQQKQHRHLPWNTEYAVMYATDEPYFDESSVGDHGKSKDQYSSAYPSVDAEARGEEDTGIGEREGNINDVHDSRAFLLTISCIASSLKWLEPNNVALRNICGAAVENPSMSIHRGNMRGNYDYASHPSIPYPTKVLQERSMQPTGDNHAILTHNHPYFSGGSNVQIPQNYPPYNYYPYQHQSEQQLSYPQGYGNYMHYDNKQWNNYNANINGHEGPPYYAQYQPQTDASGHREEVPHYGGYFQPYQNGSQFPESSERPRAALPSPGAYAQNDTMTPRQPVFQHEGRPSYYPEGAPSG